MSEEFEGVGTIEEKSEAMSKKGKFWKYKIKLVDEDFARTFNFFDYDAGIGASVGEKVKLYWYENEADVGYGLQTFRNLRSIFKTNGVPDPILSKQSDKELSKTEREINAKSEQESKVGGGRLSYNEGARIGMLFNCSVELCIAENKTTNSDIKNRFISLKKLLDELES